MKKFIIGYVLPDSKTEKSKERLKVVLMDENGKQVSVCRKPDFMLNLPKRDEKTDANFLAWLREHEVEYDKDYGSRSLQYVNAVIFFASTVKSLNSQVKFFLSGNEISVYLQPASKLFKNATK